MKPALTDLFDLDEIKFVVPSRALELAGSYGVRVVYDNGTYPPEGQRFVRLYFVSKGQTQWLVLVRHELAIPFTRDDLNEAITTFHNHIAETKNVYLETDVFEWIIQAVEHMSGGEITISLPNFFSDPA